MTLVRTEIHDSVGLITLDNPPMNVLCSQLLDDLSAAVSEMERDDHIRAVVLTGAGRAFVAGADIKQMMEMDPEQALEFARQGQGVFDQLVALAKPVIGAVNGFALGGGTELALACDVRIASEAAKFGQPEVNLGVLPGFGGTQRLARLVGPGKAKELIFTGDIIGAQAALAMGLVQQVVEGFQLDEDGEPARNEKGRPIPDNGPVVEAAMKMAEKIATKGPLAVAKAKAAIDQGLDTTLDQGLVLEAQAFAELFATADQKEGMAAFIQKRAAGFTGR